MSKKKSLLKKLFKNGGGCSCGVTVIEEKPKNNEKSKTNDNKK